MNTIPIIRLEVSGMKRTIVAALFEHQAQMDADIVNAVERYCEPENIARIVHEAARSALHNAIQEEVNYFFLYGNGRTAVIEAVKESLLNRKTYTNLDVT